MHFGYPNKRVINTRGGINILLKTATFSNKQLKISGAPKICKIFLLLYLRGRYNKNYQYRKYMILISLISSGRKRI